MPKGVRKHLHHCAKSVSCVTGIVLIWYSIGWVIEYVEERFLPGHGGLVALAAFILGILILYLPDKDLDELL